MPTLTPHRLPAAALAGLLTLSLGAGASSAGQAQYQPLGASAAGLLAYARQHSPEYAAMQLEAQAAAERVGPAGAWPDPMLRTELQNFTNAGTDAGPNLLPGRVGSTKYSITQALPFWGKRELKRAAATAELELAQARAELTWAEQAARIKVAHAQHFGSARLLALTREVVALVERMQAIAQARYANGLAAQQDAIRWQIESSAMRGELIQLETDLHHARARLNALLARAAQAALAEPQQLRPLPAATQLDPAALAVRLQQGNPQLHADQARIRASEKARDLTLRNRYPDFTVGISPIQRRNRISEWELMLELNLPLQQGSRRSQEREAELMLAAARTRQQASLNQLQAELAENLASLDAARQLEQRVQSSLLPQTELGFRAALAGYENGKLDFASVLEAQRQSRKASQDLIKAQIEQQLRLAEIEKLIGEDLGLVTQ